MNTSSKTGMHIVQQAEGRGRMAIPLIKVA